MPNLAKDEANMSADAVLIAGPTASGKSALALALAERLDGIVVNADSMQVYRELSVLSARPSSGDMLRAPHRLYGHVAAATRYSVGRYQEEAAAALGHAREAGRTAIFVGGTGLYFDVLSKGLSPIPAIAADIRAATRARFESLGREAFYTELQRRDPVTAGKLRISDTQRLLRAMDVLDSTGLPLSHWQSMSGKPALADFRVARFVLAPPRDCLKQRIERRFEAMVQSGALDEARALLDLDSALPAAKALGLSQLSRHLRGEFSLESAIAGAQMDTKRYAKRQMTWFRNRMKDWNWLENPDFSNIIAVIKRNVS
jgi:tRNA dimethylallyltransferase